MRIATGVALAIALSTAAAPAQTWHTHEEAGIAVQYTDGDREIALAVHRDLVDGRRVIETFFDQPFPRPFASRVFPDRASLTAHWRELWKTPEFEAQCWMVASGSGVGLSMLSPSAWKAEACEHDPQDAEEIRLLVAHELVHVYHGEMNPDPGLDGLEPMGWLVEGVATYVSGQLERSHEARARDAVASGAVPDELERFWSGKYRYGISGSLVRYIDRTYGRGTLLALLATTSEEQALARLGVGERELIDGWRATVEAEP